MSTANQVSKLYRTVVEDVINNVKEAFLDEGVDEQVLQELKLLWEGKLAASKALEPPPPEPGIVITPTNFPMMMPQPLPTNAQPAQGSHVGQNQAAATFQPTAAATTATLALPQGIFQQRLATIGPEGQIQNITVQSTGNGQFVAVGGQMSQLHQQMPQQVMLQQQPQQQPRQIIGLTPQQHQQIRLQQQPMRLQQPQQLQPQQRHQIIHAGGQLIQQNPVTLQNQAKPNQGGNQPLIQLDGNGDTSSSEDDDFDDDDKEEEEKDEENEEEAGEEEDPLNSDDDVSEEDPNELFETENVVVCQFDKINRNKNKWKFHFKDGIMNLNGRDFVFQKANGDSEW